MAPPKLSYFPIKALAEPIRFVLSYAGEEFIDNRVIRDDWPAMKPKTPFGKLPILEIDGKVVTQSTAICRYYAKKSGIAGEDDWENLLIDATVGTIDDLRSAIGAYHYDANEETKVKKYDPLVKEIIPFYMERLEKQVEENGGYFVNGKLTWADLWFIGLLDYLNSMAKFDIVEKYPSIQALKDKVLAVPAIKGWVAKRPATEF